MSADSYGNDYDLDKLIEKAKVARRLAYAPYSDFKVGASLLTGDGRIFTGCNIENTSYPLSICAERVAISKAVSEGYRDFLVLVVFGDTSQPTSPCGACRQFLIEFGPKTNVVMVGKEKKIEMSAADLLPNNFMRRE